MSSGYRKRSALPGYLLGDMGASSRPCHGEAEDTTQSTREIVTGIEGLARDAAAVKGELFNRT